MAVSQDTKEEMTGFFEKTRGMAQALLSLPRLQFAPITADLGNKGQTHGQVESLGSAVHSDLRRAGRVRRGLAPPLLGVC